MKVAKTSGSFSFVCNDCLQLDVSSHKSFKSQIGANKRDKYM